MAPQRIKRGGGLDSAPPRNPKGSRGGGEAPDLGKPTLLGLGSRNVMLPASGQPPNSPSFQTRSGANKLFNKAGHHGPRTPLSTRARVRHRRHLFPSSAVFACPPTPWMMAIVALDNRRPSRWAQRGWGGWGWRRRRRHSRVENEKKNSSAGPTRRIVAQGEKIRLHIAPHHHGFAISLTKGGLLLTMKVLDLD
eukprot:scaffold6824_cov118-Isochrysis_galbana.AAC.2